MTERVVGIPAAFLAVAVVMILPGFGLASLNSRRPRARPEPSSPPGPAASFVLALAWSTVFVAVAGGALLAFGWFSAGRIGVVALVASVLGVLPFARWCRSLWSRRWTVVALAALALPWAWSALRPGFPPAHGFQWYYWDLGRELNETGGIPSWTVEFGRRIDWLADYVVFNFVSEAYRAAFVGSDATAITAWRVPVAVLGLVLVHLVLRLWFGSAAAFGGAAAASATTFFIVKFDSYKTEAIGVVLLLAAVWLVVRGLREARPSWIVLAGAVSGLAVSVHAIAASVLGLLVAAAAGVEWLPRLREGRASVGLPLLAGGVVAVAVVLATGWSLQDRPTVASSAGEPELVDGVDPTWTYIKRENGVFGDAPPPSRSARLTGIVKDPWPGTDLRDPWWQAGAALLVPGIVLASLRGGRRVRRGVAVIACFAALLAAGVAFFAFAFDTFVPQHTGLSRFAQYIPLAVALALAAAIEGFVGAAAPRAGRWRRAAAPAGVVVSVVLVAAVVDHRSSSDPRISAAGRQGLAALAEAGKPGETVLSNAATRGTIEFFTGLDGLLEGRQPLIEDRSVLASTNELLLEAHEFLENSADPGFLERRRIAWLLVADSPAPLGVRRRYGGNVEAFEDRSYAELVWRRESVALFRVRGSPGPVQQLGPEKTSGGRFVLALLAVALVLAALGLGGRKLAPR